MSRAKFADPGSAARHFMPRRIRDDAIARRCYTTAMSGTVPSPFTLRKTAGPSDIDAFNHVNNARYIDWANEAAWAHSNALGLSMGDYKRIGIGCVVWRHEFDYVAPVVEGDEIDIATWIAENDNRLRLVRAYEMRNVKTGAVVFRGRTKFVSIDMATGKPARMPKEFIEAYRPQG